MIPYLRPDLVQHDLLHAFAATAPEYTETLTAGSLVLGEYVHGVARGPDSHGGGYATTWEGTFIGFAPLSSRHPDHDGPVDRLYAFFRGGRMGAMTRGGTDEWGVPVDQFVFVP